MHPRRHRPPRAQSAGVDRQQHVAGVSAGRRPGKVHADVGVGELPTSDRDFQGADATAINANCLSCHSAGMVLYQPHLGKAEWITIIEKMRHAYKAPVPDSDVTAIVQYLDAMKVGR